MDLFIKSSFESLDLSLTALLQKHFIEYSSLNLHLELNPSWNSLIPTHREQLKEALHFKKNNSQYSSISHCPIYGGFVFSNNPVGLDLEDSGRVKLETVSRISNDEERTLLNNQTVPPDVLWCAKEASFKALKDFNQPAVTSAVRTSNWHSLGQNTFSFNFSNGSLSMMNSHKPMGVVIRYKEVSIAIALLASN